MTSISRTVAPNRPSAWRVLGTDLEGASSAAEAIADSGLGGWNLRKVPLQAVDPETGLVLPVNRFAVVGDLPGEGAAVVGDSVGANYSILQNEEHAAFLDRFVDATGARFSSAGKMMGGGNRIFISMEMPETVQVGGMDPVTNYVTAINALDGSMSFTLAVTPIRIACSNVLNLAFRQASYLLRVRHSSGMHRALEAEAGNSADAVSRYLDGFQEQAEQLIQAELTQMQFEEIIEREFGAPRDASPATRTRAENRLDTMAELYADAITQDGIRGSAWAGLGALTEYWDHYAPTRGDNVERSRAQKALLEPGFKDRALDLMMALV